MCTALHIRLVTVLSRAPETHNYIDEKSIPILYMYIQQTQQNVTFQNPTPTTTHYLSTIVSLKKHCYFTGCLDGRRKTTATATSVLLKRRFSGSSEKIMSMYVKAKSRSV